MDADFSVKTNLDATEATTEIAKGAVNGCGLLFRAILGKRLAQQQAFAVRERAQAEFDDKMIHLGMARFDGSKMEYLLSPKEMANILVQQQITNAHINLTSCLEKAEKLVSENQMFNNAERVLDETFVDDWIDGASKCNTEYFRTLYAKILAGEIAEAGSFSRRTLFTLRAISQEEAEIFVKIAKYIVNGVLVYSSKDLDTNTFTICNFEEICKLIDAKLLSSTTMVGARGYIVCARESYYVFHNHDSKILVEIEKPLKEKCTISGFALTQAGKEILKITDIGVTDKNVLKHICRVMKEKNDVQKILTLSLDYSGKIDLDKVKLQYSHI